MKSLIVFSSTTGNTRKLAETAYEILPGERTLQPVAEAGSPEGYDLVCVAFHFKAGKPDPATQKYLAEIGRQKLILIATHGAAKDSDHARKGMQAAREMAADADILATFSCQGEVDAAFMEKAAAKPQPPPWLGDAPSAKGHPDETDLAQLKNLLIKTVAAL